MGGNTTERDVSAASADSEVPRLVVYNSCNDSSVTTDGLGLSDASLSTAGTGPQLTVLQLREQLLESQEYGSSSSDASLSAACTGPQLRALQLTEQLMEPQEQLTG